jgi:hypothetical protein
MKRLREVKIVLFVEFEGELSSKEIAWLAANDLKKQIAEKVVLFDVYQENSNLFKSVCIDFNEGWSFKC